jgi:hypothetical protein
MFAQATNGYADILETVRMPAMRQVTQNALQRAGNRQIPAIDADRVHTD